MLLSIGDRVQTGRFKLHSRFDRVVNFTNDGQLVSLVEEEIGAGPLNLVINNINLGEIRLLAIERQIIFLGPWRFHIDNKLIYHSDLDFVHFNIETFRNNLIVLEKIFIETAPSKSLAFLLEESRREHFHSRFERAYVRQISKGVQKLFNGNWISGVKMLKGCGFGLTPGGDDFIAGVLIGLNFIQKMLGRDCRRHIKTIYAAARGGNIFSNTFLYLAKEGLLFESMKSLIASLLYGTEKEIRQCTKRLFSIGGSSGADLGVGFFMTVRAALYSLAVNKGEVIWL
ncbi:MAG: DUF2877 domain-containing protein [bacterium]